MKVLLATMQLGRGHTQGTERYVSTLARGLRARGHAVVALAGDPERRGAARRLGEPLDGDDPLLHYPSHGWMSVRGLSPRVLRPLLQNISPDVIHLANPAHIGAALLEAARQARIPTVVTVMDFWWLCPKHTLQHYQRGVCDGDVTWQECLRCIAAGHHRAAVRRLARVPVARSVVLPLLFFGRAVRSGLAPPEVARWARRREYLLRVLNDVTAVVFPSQAARRRLEPHLRAPARYQIPYGIEPEYFDADRRARAAAGDHAARDLGQVTLAYAGALAAHKGVHLILEALHRLGWHATRLRVAGSGEAVYERRLRALAEGLNVEFLGRIPAAQMPAFYGGIDLLIVPSLWPENLPIVCLEAHAAGVEVLASRVDGITECIPDAAHLFDVASAESLAERLSAWQTGAVVHEPAAVSTAEEMVSRTEQVYREAVVQQPTAAPGPAATPASRELPQRPVRRAGA